MEIFLRLKHSDWRWVLIPVIEVLRKGSSLQAARIARRPEQDLPRSLACSSDILLTKCCSSTGAGCCRPQLVSGLLELGTGSGRPARRAIQFSLNLYKRFLPGRSRVSSCLTFK